jgi:hypothetical protein
VRPPIRQEKEEPMVKLLRVRQVVFGLAVAGALGFGTTQAVASPRARSLCDGEGQVYLGTCPGRNCGGYCPSGVGACSQGCCECRF